MFEVKGTYRLKQEYENNKLFGVWFHCFFINKDTAFLKELTGTFDTIHEFPVVNHYMEKVGQR